MANGNRPLGGYAMTMGIYSALTGAFAAWFHASGRRLPERVEPYDLALMTVATHRSSRLITKDKITQTVRAPFTEGESEQPSGNGVQRAIGELVTCPYCISVWLATAFAAGFTVAPRLTRRVAAVFTAVFGADVLQLAYHRLSN